MHDCIIIMYMDACGFAASQILLPFGRKAALMVLTTESMKIFTIACMSSELVEESASCTPGVSEIQTGPFKTKLTILNLQNLNVKELQKEPVSNGSVVIKYNYVLKLSPSFPCIMLSFITDRGLLWNYY